MIFRLLIISIFCFPLQVFSTVINADSLKLKLNEVNDTTQVIILNKLFLHYNSIDHDSTFYYAEKALKKSLDINYPRGVKFSYAGLANKYIHMGQYEKADSISTKFLDYSLSIKNLKGQGKAYFLLGLSCDYQGQYSQAIDYYVRSLQIMEDIGDMLGVANCYTNIGIVYYFEKMYDKTIINYKKAFEIVNKFGFDNLKKNLLNNIANVFYQNDQLDSALIYYKKSYVLIKSSKDESDLGTICGNIGLVFDEMNQMDSAIYYHYQAILEHEKYQNQYGLATTYKDLGKLYNSKNQFKKAIEYLLRSIELSRQINSLQVLESAYGHIHKSYYGLGDLHKAYEYQSKHSVLQDSIISERSAKQILEVETKYQSEIKEKEILKLNEQNAQKELSLLKKESENSRNKLLFILFGSIVTLGLIFMYIAFRQKKKSNGIILKQNEELNQINEEILAQRDEIENQKNLVDEKNREITASITYAKRIQEAILPPDELLKSHFSNSFVLYKPKDVVAGDFYWLEVMDDLLFFAVADCTGHGVPGAMVSVVCNGALNRSIREYELTKPSAILNKTRELVIDTFKKSEQQVMDGMDIALCVYNRRKNTLEYAGANNPLYLIKSGELEIIKADRQPIGYSSKYLDFTNHEIDIKGIDQIFLFTDGFADQFGGEDDKKLGYKNFRNKLFECHQLSVVEQKEYLYSFYEEWRNNKDQLDDVCVMGIKFT